MKTNLRYSLFVTLLALLLPHHPAWGSLMVSVTSVPVDPNGTFSAQIVGGPRMNTPNPCWGRTSCDLRFFTIDESWLPGGNSGYETIDGGGWSSKNPTSRYYTLDAWWRDVTDKGRVGRDHLPYSKGDTPCVVVAASQRLRMVGGTIVSNCAKGIVQAPTCAVRPTNLYPYLSKSLGGPEPEVSIPDVTLTCTGDASVMIETNSGEQIALGGSSQSYALLDWGAGFGNPRIVTARKNVAMPLPLRVRGVGLDLLGAGTFTGSAIINVSYY